VKTASGCNCSRVNEFAPEVVRHQKVADPANFRFDSRRLHHPFALMSGEGCPPSLLEVRLFNRLRGG
jgi:hypothetical protein